MGDGATPHGSRTGIVVHFPGACPNGIQFKSVFLVAGNDSQNGAKVGDDRAGAGKFPDDGYPLEELRALGARDKKG